MNYAEEDRDMYNSSQVAGFFHDGSFWLFVMFDINLDVHL
jgi:hypothetical protein